jgi:acyl carrier protein
LSTDDREVERAAEDAIGTHSQVKEVAVVSVGGELTAAAVPVALASASEIRDHAWALLGDERSPRTIALLTALPRNGRGEVDRAQLLRVLTEDDPPSSTYAAPRTPLEGQVADVLAEVLGAPRVGIDDDFLELGGDSLSAIEVANLLERRTGLQIPLEGLFEAATVRSLVARFGGGVDAADPADPAAPGERGGGPQP